MFTQFTNITIIGFTQGNYRDWVQPLQLYQLISCGWLIACISHLHIIIRMCTWSSLEPGSPLARTKNSLLTRGNNFSHTRGESLVRGYTWSCFIAKYSKSCDKSFKLEWRRKNAQLRSDRRPAVRSTLCSLECSLEVALTALLIARGKSLEAKPWVHQGEIESEMKLVHKFKVWTRAQSEANQVFC